MHRAVVAITETVKPRFGQLQEAVKPHLIAVQVAVKGPHRRAARARAETPAEAK